MILATGIISKCGFQKFIKKVKKEVKGYAKFLDEKSVEYYVKKNGRRFKVMITDIDDKNILIEASDGRLFDVDYKTELNNSINEVFNKIMNIKI